MPAGSTSQSQPASPLKVAIATVVFWPYGLYLLWNHPTLGKRTSWWLGGLAYVVLFTAVISRFDPGPLKADARAYARMELELDQLGQKGEKLEAAGKKKEALKLLIDWQKDSGQKMMAIRQKYKSDAEGEEFMKAVAEAKARLN